MVPWKIEQLKRTGELLPKSTIETLGTIVAAISIISLINQAIHDGFGPTLQTIIGYYDRFVDTTLGMLAPPIEIWLKENFGYLSIEMKLGSYWKHSAVLCGFYFMRNVLRLYRAKRAFLASYQLVCSVTLMLAAGLGSGLSQTNLSGFWSDFGIVMSPAIATFLISVFQGVWFATFPKDRQFRTWPDFGGSWFYFFGKQIKYGLVQLIGAIAISILILNVPLVQGLKSPGMAATLCLVVVLAIYWILVGYIAAQNAQEEHHSFFDRFARAPATEVGMAMLSTLGMVLVFCVLSAGASLAGL